MADDKTLNFEDFNNVTVDDLPSAPPTFPEGDYTGVLRGVEVRKSQNDNPMLQGSFIVTEGEYTGKRAGFRYMLTQDSLWRVKKHVVRPLGFAEDLPLGAVMAQLEGLSVAVKVVVKPGKDGDLQNEIGKIYGLAS